MASKISTDIASVVDVTARRNDSFYLKVELNSVAANKNTTITINGSSGLLEINALASDMAIRSGSYKYKFYVKASNTDNVTNTVMVGKFKVVDI